ncbi:hypothetical protein VTJ49DRAFT_4881 [Mycothermus thermophilus]|uniref:Uncharacterized protein n=1 Tax=Humicola insolens TaxID=85995 RepID=A0ABR3V563_HUMIN
MSFGVFFVNGEGHGRRRCCVFVFCSSFIFMTGTLMAIDESRLRQSVWHVLTSFTSSSHPASPPAHTHTTHPLIPPTNILSLTQLEASLLFCLAFFANDEALDSAKEGRRRGASGVLVIVMRRAGLHASFADEGNEGSKLVKSGKPMLGVGVSGVCVCRTGGRRVSFCNCRRGVYGMKNTGNIRSLFGLRRLVVPRVFATFQLMASSTCLLAACRGLLGCE